MYLYFNQEGDLTTNIPHGQILRQGSYLDITVCLDLDFFYNKEENQEDWKVNMQLGLPNGVKSTTKIVSDFSIEVFRKTNDSEITYDLIDGREYYMYKFKFTPEQATFLAGKLEIYTSLVKYVAILNQYGVSTGQYSEEEIMYNGLAVTYIEKVFGFGMRNIVDESNLHYNNLVAQINEIDIRKENRITHTLDTVATLVNHTFVDKNETSYVANNIAAVTLRLPSVINFGFKSKVNIKNASQDIQPVYFLDNVIFIKNGQKITSYNLIPANNNVSFELIHNGINIYCYIEEIER